VGYTLKRNNPPEKSPWEYDPFDKGKLNLGKQGNEEVDWQGNKKKSYITRGPGNGDREESNSLQKEGEETNIFRAIEGKERGDVKKLNSQAVYARELGGGV